MHRPVVITSLYGAAASCLAVLAGGCAGIDVHPARHAPTADNYAACARFFGALDRAVTEAGVRDVQSHPVAGYPYLRVDRFLASFRHRPLDIGMERRWVDRLQALGTTARHIEVTNLPPDRRASLMAKSPGGRPLEAAVDRCAAAMRAEDLSKKD